MNDLNKKTKNILLELSKIGVCNTGKRYIQMSNKDFEELVKIWKQWPEYWQEHSKFTIEILRKHLSEEDKQQLATHNLYIDFTGEVEIKYDNAVFVVGNSNIIIKAASYSAIKLYAFNEAEILLKCSNNSYVNLELYDNSKLKVENNNHSRVIVYCYDNSTVKGEAEIIYKTIDRGKVFNGKN